MFFFNNEILNSLPNYVVEQYGQLIQTGINPFSGGIGARIGIRSGIYDFSVESILKNQAFVGMH